MSLPVVSISKSRINQWAKFETPITYLSYLIIERACLRVLTNKSKKSEWKFILSFSYYRVILTISKVSILTILLDSTTKNLNAKMAQKAGNDSCLMEWTCGQQLCDVEFSGNTVAHSTPKTFRPAPTPSPNLSAIQTPIEDEISVLIDKFRSLKLE